MQGGSRIWYLGGAQTGCMRDTFELQINTPTPLTLLYASSLWALIWALQYRLQQKCSLLFSYNVLNKIKFTFILLKYINIYEQCCSPNKIIGAGGGKMGCNIESGLSFKVLRLNAAIVDTHRCAPVLTGAKHSYFTTGKSPLFVLFGFIRRIRLVLFGVVKIGHAHLRRSKKV